MKRESKSFGGDRPLFTLPPVMVVGGFTLDPAQKNLTKGDVIPAGTLAHVDESTRLATIVKSARVIVIAAGDAKVVTLESNEFGKPVFVVNDLVCKDLETKLADVAKITAVEETAAGLQLTLNKAIKDLSVGDAIFEVVADGENVKLFAEPNSILITDEVVKDAGDTGIDVTRNTGNGEAYARRLPPVPASLLDGNMLKGTKVAYTNSF